MSSTYRDKDALEEARTDPDSVEHEQGPTGDEYAVVDMSGKKKAPKASENQAFYQVYKFLISGTNGTGNVTGPGCYSLTPNFTSWFLSLLKSKIPCGQVAIITVI